MLFFFLLGILLLSPAQVFAAQEPAAEQGTARPISEQEIFMMLGARGAFPPAQLAEIIRQRGINFRLDDSMRKSLRKAGANEAVMAALEKAYDQLKRRTTAAEAAAVSAALAEAPPPAPPPPPLDDAAAAALIEQVRQNAIQYTNRLPDFLCLQVTRRYVDFGTKGYWQSADTIQARVAFNDHRESYQVVAVNNIPVERSLESLGGAVSTGEFGSMLRELFAPETEAAFHMLEPASLRGRPVYAYEYHVSRPHSQWQIVWEPGRAGEQRYVPAYHGNVIVDAETHQVLRMWLQAEGIPPDFPIRAAATTLDYDWAKIAELAYLLPTRAIMEMRDDRNATRNEIAFRGYRKFSAETKLTFGDLPEEPPTPPEPAGKPTTPPSTVKPPSPQQQAPAPVKPPVIKKP